MDGFFVVICAIIFVIALFWAVRTPSNWQKLVIQSAKDENIEPLTNALSKRPPLVQPRFFDEAMEYLLIHNPEVAIRLTLEFVPNNVEHKHS